MIYIDGFLKFQGNIFTAFGSAIHKVCQDNIKSDIINHENFDKTFIEELKKVPKEELKDKKELFSDMRTQGKTIINEFLPSMKKFYKNYEVVAIEHELYEDIKGFEDIKFKGFIDLILHLTDENKLAIIDLKTCGWGWEPRKKNDKYTIYQLIYYKDYYSQKFKIDIKDIDIYFCLLKRTAKSKNVENFKVSSGHRRIENAAEVMTNVLTNIKNERFMKKRNECHLCKFYRKECK